MRTNLLVLFGLLFTNITNAQEVTGILKNDTTPVQFANVVLYKSTDSSYFDGTTTDEKGKFTLTSSKKDSLFLQCYLIGYTDFTSKSFIGSKSFGDISMEMNSQIDVVEITFKKPFKETSAHGTTFNVSENPVLKTGNAKRMLQKLPGVQIKQGKSISINGKDDATVYINGKRSYMEGKDVVQYLQSIPADEILRVETYDTPPARFDAEGTGAIINIVIKKPPLGTNGRVNLEVGYGNYYKVSPTVSLNHRSEKFNIYGSLRHRSSHTGHVETDSTIIDNSNNEYLFNDVNHFQKRNTFDAKFGIDFYQNEKNTFGVYYENTSRAFLKNNNSNTTINSDIISDYDSFIGIEDNDHSYQRQNFNLDFKREINDSANFSSNLIYIRLDIENDNETVNSLYLDKVANGTTLINSVGVSNINILVHKIDYSARLKKDWRIDAGTKFSYIFNDNSFIAESGTSSNNLTLDTDLSNNFKYTELISSGYLSVQKKWSEKWKSDIGFRIEQTNFKGDSPTEELQFSNSYFNLFPNVSVVFQPAKDHQFSLLYTKRITRPNTTMLNPFVKTVNELEFESGNPYLKPVNNDMFNFKYTYLEALNVSLEGGIFKNYFAHTVNQNLETGEKTWKPSNIGNGDYLNLNIGSPIPIHKYWGAYLNFNTFYALVGDEVNSYKVNNWSVYLGNEFNLPKKWTIGISGWYNSDSYWNIWKIDPAYSFSLTINKEVGNWNFSLEAIDFLNTQYYTSRALFNDSDIYGTYKEESRIFFFNVSYRFGNSIIKAAKEKELDEAEKSRID